MKKFNQLAAEFYAAILLQNNSLKNPAVIKFKAYAVQTDPTVLQSLLQIDRKFTAGELEEGANYRPNAKQVPLPKESEPQYAEGYEPGSGRRAATSFRKMRHPLEGMGKSQPIGNKERNPVGVPSRFRRVGETVSSPTTQPAPLLTTKDENGQQSEGLTPPAVKVVANDPLSLLQISMAELLERGASLDEMDAALKAYRASKGTEPTNAMPAAITIDPNAKNTEGAGDTSVLRGKLAGLSEKVNEMVASGATAEELETALKAHAEADGIIQENASDGNEASQQTEDATAAQAAEFLRQGDKSRKEQEARDKAAAEKDAADAEAKRLADIQKELEVLPDLTPEELANIQTLTPKAAIEAYDPNRLRAHMAAHSIPFSDQANDRQVAGALIQHMKEAGKAKK